MSAHFEQNKWQRSKWRNVISVLTYIPSQKGREREQSKKRKPEQKQRKKEDRLLTVAWSRIDLPYETEDVYHRSSTSRNMASILPQIKN
ncbi:hypothetical protein CEXT_267551 [Caerostris extrusa]|uniref:Uncharacterized protein n=1 Tax=Caerostris extrusa TaxID=172846 RepID=A0AAV4QEI9_CAEEX|nr:hypothetical protein CEXT_267551 [Caerostris extrusa]